MTADSLKGWLAAVGIPAELVCTRAERDDAWCLLPGPEGSWDVFWLEQGNRYDWARFDDETVACHYLFGRLTWAQVVRGAVGVLDAADTGPHTIG